MKAHILSPVPLDFLGSMSFRVETRLTRRARLGSAQTEGRDITIASLELDGDILAARHALGADK